MCSDNAGHWTLSPFHCHASVWNEIHSGAENEFPGITREQKLIFGMEIIWYFVRTRSTTIKKKNNQPQPNKTPKKELYHQDKRDMGTFVGVKIAFFPF